MTTTRRHTIIVTHDEDGCITGLQLEKDWYSYEFAQAYPHRITESRPQGDFMFLCLQRPISQLQARLFTDNVIQGKIKTVMLRDFSQQKMYLNGGK